MASYEAVIKVNREDSPGRRARAIAEGIGYACALLMDEYGWDVNAITGLLESTTDEIEDEFQRRAGSAGPQDATPQDQAANSRQDKD